MFRHQYLATALIEDTDELDNDGDDDLEVPNDPVPDDEEGGE